MDPIAIRKSLDKIRRKIEKEFDVIIVQTNDEYIAYENKACQKENKILCKSTNLTDLREDLKLYLK